MNNKIDTLELNKGLKVIDNAAFHINKLNAIIIPQSVEKIGSSAFRECEATTVIFEEGSNLSNLCRNNFEQLFAYRSYHLTYRPYLHNM